MMFMVGQKKWDVYDFLYVNRTFLCEIIIINHNFSMFERALVLVELVIMPRKVIDCY